MILSKLIGLVMMATAVAGHAQHTPEEMVTYHQQVARDSEALRQCLQTAELKELHARVVAERQQSFRRMRKARGIDIQSRGQSWHDLR